MPRIHGTGIVGEKEKYSHASGYRSVFSCSPEDCAVLKQFVGQVKEGKPLV